MSASVTPEPQRVSPVATRTFTNPALGALGFHPLIEVTDERGAEQVSIPNHKCAGAA